jgi:hypothetical protein
MQVGLGECISPQPSVSLSLQPCTIVSVVKRLSEMHMQKHNIDKCHAHLMCMCMCMCMNMCVSAWSALRNYEDMLMPVRARGFQGPYMFVLAAGIIKVWPELTRI